MSSLVGEGAARALPPHFFRHAYAHLVACISRRVGVAYLAEVEDAVQSALEKAVSWSTRPDDPIAWLYRVAVNSLLDERRTAARRRELVSKFVLREDSEQPEARLAEEIDDDLLRMLFACSDPRLPPDSQTILALKVLCGFSVREVAQRVFRSEADVYKRLSRARVVLKTDPQLLAGLEAAVQKARLPRVQTALYLLFTEGHLSSKPAHPLRRELCDEAIRLALMLTGHGPTESPGTSALLALMYLHRARLPARRAPEGLVLLERQDRSLWDQDDISRGMRWLERSAVGRELTRYHLEAAVAAEHVLAPSFEETRWARIAALYAQLEALDGSPMHRLNRALALAEAVDPTAGLALLEAFTPPVWLEGSYLWTAAKADLLHRAGQSAEAAVFRQAALTEAPSLEVSEALNRRWRGEQGLRLGQPEPM